MTALFEIDFRAANNEDWREAFILQDDSQCPPVPYNIAGATFAMAFADRDGNTVLGLGTFDNSISLTSGVPGGFQIQAPASKMKTIQQGSYVYDLLMTLNGATVRLFYGKLQVVQGVTPAPGGGS
jgi:hypothetical protein